MITYCPERVSLFRAGCLTFYQGSMLPRNVIYLFRFTLSATMAVIFILSVVRIEQALPGGLSDKFYHSLAFFVLGVLSALSFPEPGFSYKKCLLLFSYGVLIEVVQYFLPYRSFSFGDMVADAVGIFACFFCVRGFSFLGVFFRKNKFIR